ncbi:hypothetical protein YP76_14635 [Sphingobium chungbukense]|uniref:Uncharacterized protein n=1 Tax=Sphingobium chungbukense TaxID=56193 RepID=A0A0M3AN68_9SPHN|nr:hypothetical protein YP76_14635 [Sphingobium chungbukense]
MSILLKPLEGEDRELERPGITRAAQPPLSLFKANMFTSWESRRCMGRLTGAAIRLRLVDERAF